MPTLSVGSSAQRQRRRGSPPQVTSPTGNPFAGQRPEVATFNALPLKGESGGV